MRKVLTWMLSGALAGVVVATIAAPWVLEKLLASTGAKDAMCQCTELVSNTATLLIKTQLWGGAAGAVIVPLVAWLTRRQFGRDNTPGAGDSPVAAPDSH